MAKKTKQPAWLIPKKKPNTSSMSTRNVVKKHLKEWNRDEDEKPKRYIKEGSKTHCPNCGIKKSSQYIGYCPDCAETWGDN